LKVTFPSLKYALLPEIDTEIVGDNGKAIRGKPRTCNAVFKQGHARIAHDNDELHLLNARELQRAMDVITHSDRRSRYADFAAVKKGQWIGTVRDFRNILAGKRGFIFLEELYPGRYNNDGSHFDLWNGKRTKNEVFSGEISEKYFNCKGIRFWQAT
jgi:hypothetical protein